ncbi:MAG: transposase [Bacteroidetes bacterium]|nr:transposase [Bacteroidota bacterium]
MVEGTCSEKINEVLECISKKKQVKEVAFDMAGSINKIISNCFPQATNVIDRFHIQNLAYDALQEMRIAYRWDAINEEIGAIENARTDGTKHLPILFSNEDSRKQLLARSRYLLFKSIEKWTEKQKQRPQILSEQYPNITKAYKSNASFENNIFSN